MIKIDIEKIKRTREKHRLLVKEGREKLCKECIDNWEKWTKNKPTYDFKLYDRVIRFHISEKLIKYGQIDTTGKIIDIDVENNVLKVEFTTINQFTNKEYKRFLNFDATTYFIIASHGMCNNLKYQRSEIIPYTEEDLKELETYIFPQGLKQKKYKNKDSEYYKQWKQIYKGYIPIKYRTEQKEGE